jgi:hypothetical protein
MTARSFRLLALSAAVGLAGCGASPKVSYQQVNGPDDKGLIKFRLQRSTILVDYKKDKDGKDVTTEIALTSVPADRAGDPVYAMTPEDNLFMTTHLKVVHRANTDLLESLGTEIEDKRVQFIQQVGAFVTGLLGVAGASAGKLPSTIDVTKLIEDAGEKKGQAIILKDQLLPDQTTIKYDIDISAAPADAIARDTFIASNGGKMIGVLFYAACRDAKVKFTTNPAQDKVFNLRISDPNFVQTIKLPAKGKIDLHTGCGVNVTSEKSDVATDMKLVNELISQVKSIRDAAEKKDAATGTKDAGKK